MGPLLARTFFFCKWLHKFPRFLRHEGKFSTMDGAPRATDAETPGSRHSPVSAARAVPSAWWTPAWNLTFSTTRQTCPGWRCGCACDSLRCPRGRSSLAPSHPRPSTSCPCLAGVAKRGGGPRPWQCWLQWALSSLLRRLRLVGSLRSPALCTAARRLRLRPRLVQLGLGLRAPPVPQSASSYTQIAFHPQPPPSHDRGEGITQPTPGVVDVQLWEFLAVTTPLPVSRPLGLGSRSLGRLLVGGDSS